MQQAKSTPLAALHFKALRSMYYGLLRKRLQLLLQVLAMINHQNYLYRMTVLSAIVALAPNVPQEILSNAMLPAAVACSKVGM